jgi:hypothetical protein
MSLRHSGQARSVLSGSMPARRRSIRAATGRTTRKNTTAATTTKVMILDQDAVIEHSVTDGEMQVRERVVGRPRDGQDRQDQVDDVLDYDAKEHGDDYRNRQIDDVALQDEVLELGQRIPLVAHPAPPLPSGTEGTRECSEASRTSRRSRRSRGPRRSPRSRPPRSRRSAGATRSAIVLWPPGLDHPGRPRHF